MRIRAPEKDHTLKGPAIRTIPLSNNFDFSSSFKPAQWSSHQFSPLSPGFSILSTASLFISLFLIVKADLLLTKY